jgi:hypothetical protein
VIPFSFTKQRPREPATVDSAVSGLSYDYFEGAWEHLPDFDTVLPTASGHVAAPDFSVRRRDVNFAIRFTGYVDVPHSGTYTFFLTSDDGSRLWIGDRLVVDHDGLHSESEQLGQIILKSGKHPITIAAFQAGGGRILSAGYKGPGIAKQPIPASAFWRRPTSGW